MGFWRDLFYVGVPETSATEPENRADSPALFVREDSPLPPVDPMWGTGDGLTANDAMSLTEVYRAVSILVTSSSQLSIDTWKNDAPSNAPLWVKRPDVKISRSAWIGELVTSLALTGNAFLRVIRDDNTDATSPVRALIVLNPADTFHQVDAQGNVTGYKTASVSRDLRPHEVRHMALLRTPGRVRGLGPIQAAREDLFAAMETRTYGSRFFDTSGVPSGTLKTGKTLSPERAKQYQDQWNSMRGRGIRVLGDDLQYEPILVSPEDAQFLQSRNFSAVQIARLFGISPRMMLVDGGSDTYANVQDEYNSFLRFTLSQYTREIEEAISDLLPRNTVARFNYDALLRQTTNARYEAHEVALRAGFMTINEVRHIEGLPDLPEATSASQEATDDAS